MTTQHVFVRDITKYLSADKRKDSYTSKAKWRVVGSFHPFPCLKPYQTVRKLSGIRSGVNDGVFGHLWCDLPRHLTHDATRCERRWWFTSLLTNETLFTGFYMPLTHMCFHFLSNTCECALKITKLRENELVSCKWRRGLYCLETLGDRWPPLLPPS